MECCGRRDAVVEMSDPQPTLETMLADFRRRIRTQVLKVDQLKTMAFENKQRTRKALAEDDMVGARGWLIESKRYIHMQELEWNRYLTNTRLLASLEGGIANMEQAHHISRVNARLSDVLLQMPPDLNEIIDRVQESIARVDETSEQLAYFEPRSVDVDDELNDLQLQRLATPVSAVVTLRREREKLLQ